LSGTADDVIAIGIAAARLAEFDTTVQPAARFVGEILEKESIHRTLKADMQMRDLALRQGNDLHVGVGHSFEQAGYVFLVTGEPIHAFEQRSLSS
jgi:hypothetical protein